MLDIEKIKAAALAATQGEWKLLDIQSDQPQIIAEQGKSWNNPTICNFYDDVTPKDSVTIGNWYEQCLNNEANATYIATANPSAVLELIERLEAVEQESIQLREWLNEERVMAFELNNRLRAAEKDAARYRWLRNPDQDVGNVIDKRIGTPHDIMGVCEYRAGDELDSVIDEAMKEKS